MTLTDVKLGDLIAQLEVLKPYNLGGGVFKNSRVFLCTGKEFL